VCLNVLEGALDRTQVEVVREWVLGIGWAARAQTHAVCQCLMQKIDRIRQIDGFHVLTWLKALDVVLQSLTINLEQSAIL
jgi:hypothetical protein